MTLIHSDRHRIVAVSASLLALVLLLPVTAARADESSGASPFDSIDWVEGPGKGALGSLAEVDVPAGYRFTAGAGTRVLLNAMENPTNGSELGLLAPDEFGWFVVFEYDDSGHVPDDDGGDLDADALLASIKEGTRAGNEERRRRGWTTMEIVGWEVKPQYNPASHNLEWAVRARSDGGDVVNHNTRVLGRTGVMEVSLVCGPEELNAILPNFRGLLDGYTYRQGQKYSEYRQGDKLAKYGLAALVTGGAAAVALKTGLFAKLGKGAVKLLIIAGVAIAAVFRKLFGRRRPAADRA